MALSMKDLQEVLAPITELGRGEDSFEINGIPISIRTLSPDEEIAVQRYARVALTDGEANDHFNTLDYLDRFRVGSLSYAITRIGKLDLHGVDTIETGEILPSGVAVKILKHEAIQEAIKPWSRAMQLAVYEKFHALMERIELAVEKNVSHDMDHLDAQIARLEERLAELRDTKVKKTVGETDPRGDTADLAANRVPKPEPVEPPQETWVEARKNRTTEEEPLGVDVGEGVPKAVVEESEAPPPKPEGPRRPVFGTRPPPREPPPVEDPLAGIPSSLVDTSDPDVIEAENRRLFAERGRVPPHMAAREVARAVEGHEQPEAPQPPRPPVPASRGGVNPRFRPAKM